MLRKCRILRASLADCDETSINTLDNPQHRVYTEGLQDV